MKITFNCILRDITIDVSSIQDIKLIYAGYLNKTRIFYRYKGSHYRSFIAIEHYDSVIKRIEDLKFQDKFIKKLE